MDAKETLAYLYQHGHIIQHEHYKTICDKIDRLTEAVKAKDGRIAFLEEAIDGSHKHVDELQAEIKRIRPRADCYQRVCETLGIEKDILGYVKSQQAEIDQLIPYKSKVILQVNEQQAEIKRLKDLIDDLRHGLNDIGCDPSNECYSDCIESAKYLVAETLKKMQAAIAEEKK